MRRALKKIEDRRCTFTGIFERYGIKNGYRGEERTLLLKDIKNKSGRLMTGHLWFNLTKGFQALGNLEEGTLIQFDARSKEYEKGYKGYRDDVYKPVEHKQKNAFPFYNLLI